MLPTLLLCTAALASIQQAGGAVGSRPPGPPADTILVIPDSSLIAEDVAWDPRTRTWYVSSVRHRKVIAIGPDGVSRDFIPTGSGGLWSAFAIALDTARDLLWVTSAATREGLDTPASDLGRTALFSFQLGSGRLVSRHELPRDSIPRALADLDLLEDGRLVVSDSRGGGVYLLDAAGLRPLVAPRTFRSPQEPAAIPGTPFVLVPDYSRGLALVNLESGRVTWLLAPADLDLKGIDGMRFRGRTLIAVQNGLQPNRVVRLDLDDQYRRVTSWEPLIAGVGGLREPTHGVVIADDFVFIANSGWDHVGDDGDLLPGEPPARPMLWRIPAFVTAARSGP